VQRPAPRGASRLSILIGPVRCIGCEPSAPPAAAARFQDEAHHALPIWPGCVPITIAGEIVRRRQSSSATAER
jgi:hypothetical protein